MGVGITRRHKTAPVATETTPRAALRLRWEPGHAYVYALDVTTEQRATPAGQPGQEPIEGTLALRGELVVRCHAAHQHGYTLGISLRNLSKTELAVMGAQGLQDPALFDGKEAFVDIDDRGQVGKVYYARNDADELKAVMGAVVALVQVTLPEDATEMWATEEPGILGSARSQYATDASSPLAISRHHTGYTRLLGTSGGVVPDATTLSSDDTIVLAADGALASLKIHEHVAVPAVFDAEVTASVLRVREETFAPAPLALDERFEARKPNQVLTPKDAEHTMLTQLAGGLTLEDLEATMLAYGRGAAMPSGFVTRAVTLLKLYPDYAQALVELFERPTATFAVRTALCDILASAGHPQAQAALRDALSSAAGQQNPRERGTLLQRVGFLQKPEKETAAFVFHEYDATKNADVRSASAFALGATAGNLARGGDMPGALVYNARLRRDLDKARSEKDRVSLLAALGNVGIGDNVATVRSFSKDKSATVRKQVAYSLRKTETADAKDTLLDLAGDDEVSVGLAAMSSIQQGPVSRETMQRVAQLAQRGLSGELNEALITFAGTQRSYRDDAVAILRAIQTRTSDPHTQARVQMVLEAYGVN